MGAVSPVPFASKEFMQRVENRVVKPTIDGLNAEGIDYKGFVFVGLMNVDGNPHVIEYNARMGDPETQVVLPRLKTDLLELLVKVSENDLSNTSVEFYPETATAVILVSGGYPGSYEKGKAITGLHQKPNTLTFHAGTKFSEGENLITSGGRVLAAVGISDSIEEALNLSYQNAHSITFEGKYFRSDIGQDIKQ